MLLSNSPHSTAQPTSHGTPCAPEGPSTPAVFAPCTPQDETGNVSVSVEHRKGSPSLQARDYPSLLSQIGAGTALISQSVQHAPVCNEEMSWTVACFLVGVLPLSNNASSTILNVRENGLVPKSFTPLQCARCGVLRVGYSSYPQCWCDRDATASHQIGSEAYRLSEKYSPHGHRNEP